MKRYKFLDALVIMLSTNLFVRTYLLMLSTSLIKVGVYSGKCLVKYQK